MDVSVAGIVVTNNAANVTFAAPSHPPDTGTAPATNYQLESMPILGPSVNWQTAADLVVGDDHMHTITLPLVKVKELWGITGPTPYSSTGAFGTGVSAPATPG